jgi:hypothetical protein
MKNKIKIIYDGEYPNLCSGNLSVEIDNKIWEFPDRCLKSNGEVYFDQDWNDYITKGLWDITEWPKDFPEYLKKEVLDAINDNIPHGCCGGCV